MSEAALAPEINTETVMSLSGVVKIFGALRALDGVSFDIRRGEILGVAGPNGAGKTTLLNVCTGVLPATAGEILFDGRRIDKLPAHRCCHLGIARTFQIPQIFSSLTVAENVAIGAEFGQLHKTASERVELASQIMDLVGLTQQQSMPVSQADLLTRKRIMLAAALATRPKLVFLDEPLSGLNTEEVETFVDLFRRLHAALGLTFVIVEHKVKALASLSDRILILNFGSVLTIDPPDEVLSDPQVIEIYLGSRNLA